MQQEKYSALCFDAEKRLQKQSPHLSWQKRGEGQDEPPRRKQKRNAPAELMPHSGKADKAVHFLTKLLKSCGAAPSCFKAKPSCRCMPRAPFPHPHCSLVLAGIGKEFNNPMYILKIIQRGDFASCFCRNADESQHQQSIGTTPKFGVYAEHRQLWYMGWCWCLAHGYPLKPDEDWVEITTKEGFNYTAACLGHAKVLPKISNWPKTPFAL